MNRRTVVGILGGIFVVTAGMLVGFSVAATGFTLPSDDEINDAAHTLVPPGWTVDQVIAGRPSMPFGGLGGLTAYRVIIDATAQTGTHLEQLAETEATARKAGWEESGRTDHPGGMQIKYDRGALTATVTVFKSGTTLSVKAEKDTAKVGLHRTIGAAIGGAVALGAWVAWRHRKPGQGTGARSESP